MDLGFFSLENRRREWGGSESTEFEAGRFGRSLLNCTDTDRLCIALEHEYEVIIVPVVLIGATCIVVSCILWLSCQHKEEGEKLKIEGLERGPHDTCDNSYIVLHEASPSNILEAGKDPSHAQFEIPRERLTFTWGEAEKIRNGTYGPIYRTKMASRNSEKVNSVVIKVLRDSAKLEEIKEFLDRIKFHSFLGKHPNIVELVGCCTDRFPIFHVMEDVELGDLLSFLWKCRKDVIKMDEVPYDITEKQVYNIAFQVVAGLEYLNQKKLIHGDVAARNVLIASNFTAKLCGLGIAFDIHNYQVLNRKRVVPLKWQAPERMMRMPQTDKSDVWSFGILLYEMVTLGAPPYPEVPPENILQHLQRGQRMKSPANCKSQMYNIMKQCWQWKQSDRLTLADLRRRLDAGRKAANDRVVLQFPEFVVPGPYANVAGIAESTLLANYTAL
ncbi:tyrosine-protein kinase STYK1 [Latimeria chalumnae]|uniref:tyrosine-protein kinase STYK1 n=1 Tax=Latimeria chalumnae TaxID=7897 RepID=UPI00313D27CF